jgi:hypothetical protein
VNEFHRLKQALLGAGTEREIRALLTECLAQISPEEMRVLPENCQMAFASREMDLHDAAMDVLRCDLNFAGDSVPRALLHEVAAVFAAASIRLAQLQARSAGR